MRIVSPAKINLFLHITGKRRDGYHDLFTLMSCVKLADVIHLDFDTDHISLYCEHDQVPRDISNHAVRAAAIFFEQARIKPGVAITLEKNVPVAAGLGGGSSNAAAVLKALNRHYGSPFSQQQLHRMATGIGADVPFFLYGKPALATGIGDRLTAYLPLEQLPVIIIKPNFSVSTAEIYKSFSLGLTNDKKTITDYFFTEKTAFNAAIHLVNDLERITAARHPEIHQMKRRLLDHGATGSLMSGSGPSVFGLFSTPEAAQKAYDGLRCSERDERIFLTNLVTGDDATK
ncbi:MAG: 4-(cytidine 5'-diphospho)-2-C-methyl-D-erythritol kinase [Thermodesulfobacteriota bacterium]